MPLSRARFSVDGRATLRAERPTPAGMITKQVEAAQRGEDTDFGLFRTYAGSLRQLHKLVRADSAKQARQDQCSGTRSFTASKTAMTTYKNAIGNVRASRVEGQVDIFTERLRPRVDPRLTQTRRSKQNQLVRNRAKLAHSVWCAAACIESNGSSSRIIHSRSSSKIVNRT